MIDAREQRKMHRTKTISQILELKQKFDAAEAPVILEEIKQYSLITSDTSKLLEQIEARKGILQKQIEKEVTYSKNKTSDRKRKSSRKTDPKPRKD